MRRIRRRSLRSILKGRFRMRRMRRNRRLRSIVRRNGRQITL